MTRRSMTDLVYGRQQKQAEIESFDKHAEGDEYNAFTETANRKIIDAFVSCTGLRPGARIVDLGCGTGTFTRLLSDRGYSIQGVDLSPKLVARARETHPHVDFLEGDIESLPLADRNVDGVLLSSVLHHLPDPSKCAAEVYRILKPGGWFFAFDPNRLNPFMFLYRDPSSPFYSPIGVTANERPVRAANLARTFSEQGCRVFTSYLGGLSYRYVASSTARRLLPVYNIMDRIISAPKVLSRFRPFVLTYGQRV